MYKAKNFGFTLIELLIVIVVMFALVVLVLADVNPIERIRKSKDLSKELDALELFSAYEKYNLLFQKYPWEKAPEKIRVSDENAGILGLIEGGVVREEFEKRQNLNELFVSAREDGLHVCFVPESKYLMGQAKHSKNCNGELAEVTGAKENCVCVPE